MIATSLPLISCRDNKSSGEELIHSKFRVASNFHNGIKNYLNRIVEEFSASKAYSIFEKIPKTDFVFLNMDYRVSSPHDMLLTHVLVPPVPLRPSVTMTASLSNEDDLTIKIREMLYLKKAISDNIESGQNTNRLLEDINLLQYTHCQYINADTRGLPLNLLGNKQIRAFCQRLKGKNGRFRQNLSGKRVDFSGRTVISPDPNLRIDQVGVPKLMAVSLTYPQRVFEKNLEFCRKLVLNGPDVHPGALYVTSGRDGQKTSLSYADRSIAAANLEVGDLIERHLVDNDIVLFNRQPSLHRQSIMAFYAKVLPGRTLRFNESVCAPFNADFDGDEMNIHLPQSEEAKAEALHLLGVKNNIVTPKSADPLIAATQDFLTTFYLVTKKDYFMNRQHFFQCISFFSDALMHIEVPIPCILKPEPLWSGKQLFSVLLKTGLKEGCNINLRLKEKIYSDKDEEMCVKDGFVCIRDNELLCGNMLKKTMGGGSKAGLTFALLKESDVQSTADFLVKVSKFSARWLTNKGMTFGITDVTPSDEVKAHKKELISKSYDKCYEQIDLFKQGKIELKPGCNEEQSLESIINKELSSNRDKLGAFLNSNLTPNNNALKMSISGAKGSNINLCQMVGLVGQQVVSGSRIPDGFIDRTLPHFEINSKEPDAKGFVSNSFYTGLNALEFFFHTVGGREGLVDTAVKTAETGYMQRRLMKGLEDLTAFYDYSVKTSIGEVMQFKYGDDCVDPVNMEKDGPVCLDRIMTRNSGKTESFQKILSPSELETEVKAHLDKCPIKDRIEEAFMGKIEAYFIEIIREMESSASALQLSSFNPSSQKELELLERLKKSTRWFTFESLGDFFIDLWNTYLKSLINPGEAVGAVAGQSIGEPGTQMTLKTFHFAGVASMNITLGVPRIKEIINATKDISTPIITSELDNNGDTVAARIVKGRIEKTQLGDIVEYIKEVYVPHGLFLSIKIDRKTVEELQLEVDIQRIKQAIIKHNKLKIKEKNIVVEGEFKMRIEPPESSRDQFIFAMQNLKSALRDVIVCGIDTVNRAVINKKSESTEGSVYNLLIEGTGLTRVMNTPGIDWKKTTCNDILEVEKTLGIEATRQTIIKELQYTFEGHSIYIDPRHLNLVADLMTFKGQLLGITRFGISKMNYSTLMNASFEKTIDHLFDAGFHSRVDTVSGVSESIIMGKTMNIGTGMFKVHFDVGEQNVGKCLIKKKKEDKAIYRTKSRIHDLV